MAKPDAEAVLATIISLEAMMIVLLNEYAQRSPDAGEFVRGFAEASHQMIDRLPSATNQTMKIIEIAKSRVDHLLGLIDPRK